MFMTFSVLPKILNVIYRLLTNFLDTEILYTMIFNLSVRFFTVTVTILNKIYLFEIINPNILGLFLYLQRNFFFDYNHIYNFKAEFRVIC